MANSLRVGLNILCLPQWIFDNSYCMRQLNITLLTLLLPTLLMAELQVSSFFGDHMVLQRDHALPVWGQATPGDTVTVSFKGDKVSTKADADGQWIAKLPAQDVGAPGTLRIESSGQSVVFSDVLVGEVWLCSGQSNMNWPVQSANNAKAEIAAANNPSIRLFDVARAYSPEPLKEVDASWAVCSPETVAKFSAVGYFFGRELWDELQVPIGLISSNWGGTPAEAWTPLETMKGNPAYKALIEKYEASTAMLASNSGLDAEMQAKFDNFMETAGGIIDNPPMPEKIWFDPEATIEGTEAVYPDKNFFSETDGLANIRNVFTLTDEQAKLGGARILLGEVDNYDTVWINGIKVGKTGREEPNERDVQRVYSIPDGILKPGANVVLIQLVDWAYNAVFGRKIEQPHIAWSNGSKQGLADDGWEMKILTDLGKRPETLEREMRNTTAYLYNGMIAPLTPAAIRGVIWYQGEGNASRAYQYRSLFPDMINAWRTVWQSPDMPFYFVQLANYQDRNDDPEEHPWAELRDAQLNTLKLANTGMAVAIDIGEADDIHPRNKQDVGKRLSLWALAKTYGITEDGEPIPHSGPLLRKSLVKKGEIVLRFDHVYGGLKTSDGGPLRGFAIAEKHGSFQWAEARIEGTRVVVSHPDMKKPRYVRYAWATNPEANLVNEAGLPASPFRTDERPYTTAE